METGSLRSLGHPEEAVDRDRASRPGVPMYGRLPEELRPAAPLEQQPADVEVLTGVETGGLTPVFGTTLPPRGLSGAIRRVAYRVPEHKAGRWLLLMLGDRVDVWESRARRHPLVTAGIAIALVSWAIGAGVRATRRRW